MHVILPSLIVLHYPGKLEILVVDYHPVTIHPELRNLTEYEYWVWTKSFHEGEKENNMLVIKGL
jgi:hypothetical protein